MKVLFSGLGTTRVAWYRCVLPAMYTQKDWAGVANDPPQLAFMSGFVDGATKMPEYESYDIVVLQQPRGQKWFTYINELKARGITVLYEIDDYVHGIRKLPHHDFANYFKKADITKMELCMRACDGLIVSTDYLAQRYRSFNRNVWVCENGLDLVRYAYSRPQRPSVNGVDVVTLLWAGATGHGRSAAPWINEVKTIMAEFEHVNFLSIGQDFTGPLSEFGSRARALPFAALDTYPAAMAGGDISLAPLGQTAWHRAKSDLRAMESAALGITIVADRHYENSVVDRETGYIVDSATEARERIEHLIRTPALIRKTGNNARVHAGKHFGMSTRRSSWETALNEAVNLHA